MGYTPRPVQATPEGPRAGVGCLGMGSQTPPHQLGEAPQAVSGAKLRNIWILEAFWDLRNHCRTVTQLQVQVQLSFYRTMHVVQSAVLLR